MKQEIQELFKNFLAKSRDEKALVSFFNDNAPFLLDEDGDFDNELFADNIDKVSSLLLPGLDKYDPKDVVEALLSFDVLDQNAKYQLAFSCFPTNILLEYMRYCYHDNKESFLENITIVRDGQIELLAELGFSYKEMLPLVENNKYYVNLYQLDKSLFDEILNNHFHSYSMKFYIPMILEEYHNGGDYVLATVLSKLGDYNNNNSEFLNLFINELVSINRFDINKLISSLELSSLEYQKFISCVTDENVMRRMIKVSGAKALIFCKDFSPEIVELASEFTFEDYKMFDGDYKKSPALLKLISENYPNHYPLYHCKSEALTPETAVYLSKFADDVITNVGGVNSNLSKHYLLYKELKARGLHVDFYSIDDLYTNVNAFNFVIECFSDGTLEDSVPMYGNLMFAYCIFKKEYEKLSNLRFYDTISREVAEAIVALGFSANDYIKYFKHHDELSDIYLEQGNVEVLFMREVPDKYIKEHSDLITYDMYLKLKETNPSFVFGHSFLKKIVEQGHYDVLYDIDLLEISDYLKLKHIGLDEMTYEEFLVADPIVRKVPALMLKFMDRDPSLFDEYAKLFPDSEIVIKDKINSGNLSCDEFMKLTKNIGSGFSSLVIDEEIIMKYLREGHIEFLSRLSSNVFTTKVLDYIIDNFDINNLSEDLKYNINYYLIERLIDRKDFSFLHLTSYLSEHVMKRVVKSGFTLEDFNKSGYQGLDYLEYYISKENEDSIIKIIEQYIKKVSRHLYFNSSFVVKCINEGFDIDNINYLVSCISVNIIDFLKEVPKEKYHILNQLNINGLFVNKTVADLLLNVLSIEKTKASLAYCTEDIRKYIISKMVNLGHYDFIDCYVSGIDEDVVKKALLSGYFPVDTILANGVFRNKITSIKFTAEELEYLRTKLDSCPYLVVYFEDIVSRPALLNEYLINEPNLLMFFSGDIVNNISTLYEVYKNNKNVFEILISRRDITDETIVDLYLTYDLDCECIYNKLNHSILSELVVKYPYLIEHYCYVYESEILKAFESGYKLNDNSKSSAIVVAFQYGYNQPGDDKYFEKLETSDFRKILTKVSYDVFSTH